MRSASNGKTKGDRRDRDHCAFSLFMLSTAKISCEPRPSCRSSVLLEATAETLKKELRAWPVLWVGAGVSAAAGYPSTGELVAEMIGEADDPIAPELPFPTVADAFVASRGEGALGELLQRLIGPPRPLTPLHRAIARLAAARCFHTLVTTNYDRLLERALDEAGVAHVSQHLEQNATIAGRGEVRLLKLHGSREDWATVILSGRSYETFHGRYRSLWRELDLLLRRHSILFVGCSLQDPRLLDWLAGLSEEEARRLKPWRALMTEKEWQAAANAAWRSRRAADVLAKGNIRPLLLRDHDHLQELWSCTAAELVAEEARIETAIRAPARPLQAPPLPPHFVPRPEASEHLKAALLAEHAGAHRTLRGLAVLGLGGVGKSTLAASLVREADVRARFPAGVLWATLGRAPDLLALLSGWVQALGDYEFHSTSVEASANHLRSLLQDRAAVLVVDDAWDPGHVEQFLVGGPRCRVLITTRESLGAVLSGAVEYDLDVLTAEQAMELVIRRLGRALTKAEREPARALVAAVGRLPLALELAAVQIGEGLGWTELLADLRAEIACLETLELPGAEEIDQESVRKRLSLLASFHLSLARLSGDERRAFAWLGVLPEDATLNPAMATTLWDVPERQARRVLRGLRNRSLLLAAGDRAPDAPIYRVHDLLHDLARRLLTDPPVPARAGRLPGLGLTLVEAHDALLERYRRRLPEGRWSGVSDDGYIHEHLCWHLEQAGRAEEVHALLGETTTEGRNGWYEARNVLGQLAGFVEDVARGWRLSAARPAGALQDREPVAGVGLQLRYALVTASLNSLARRISPDLTAALIAEGIWTPRQAHAHARQVPDPTQRAAALTALLSRIPEPERPEVLRDAVVAGRAIGPAEDRAAALSRIGPHLTGTARDQILEEALAACQELAEEPARVEALMRLAPHLSEPQYQRALGSVRGLGDARMRVKALAGLAVYLPASLRESALALAQEIERPTDRVEVLLVQASHLPEPVAGKALREALSSAMSGRSAAQARQLGAIVLALGARDTDEAVWKEALAATGAIEGDAPRARLLAAAAPHLPGPLLRDAGETARAIGSPWYRVRSLTSLIPYLPPAERPGALKETFEMARGIEKPWRWVGALADLASRLPPVERPGVLLEALETARAIESPWHRANALADLASHLPPAERRGVLEEAAAAASRSRPASLHTKAMTALAVRMAELCLPEEALAAARAIATKPGRVTALLALLPLLPPDRRDAVVGDLPAAARGLDDFWQRARALAELAGYLPQPAKGEALAEAEAVARWHLRRKRRDAVLAAVEAARQADSRPASSGAPPPAPERALIEALRKTQRIGDRAELTEALVALVPGLSDAGREEVLPAIVGLARAMPDLGRRSRALHELAPYRADLSGEALRAAEAVLAGGRPEEALASLAALGLEAPRSLLRKALAVAHRIKEPRARAGAVARLAARLAAAGCPRQALAGIRKLKSGDDRAEALTGLMPHLDDSLKARALAETLEAVQPDGIGFRALEALAPHLSPALLEEWLTAAQQGWAGDYLVHGLVALIPHLREPARSRAVRDALEEALDIAPNVRELAALAPYLPLPERFTILEQELSTQRTFGERSFHGTLLLFARYLPEERQRQAVQAARAIPDPAERAGALRALVPHLPEPLQRQALSVALRIRDPRVRSKALAGLMSVLPQPLRRQVVAGARRVKSSAGRSAALTALLPGLEGPLRTRALRQALVAARAIDDESSRARALSVLVPHLPDAERRRLAHEALNAAAAIRSPETRLALLTGLAPELDGVPQAQLYPPWAERLRHLANGTRSPLLRALGDPGKGPAEVGRWLTALGGGEAVAEACRALLDVSRWWP